MKGHHFKDAVEVQESSKTVFQKTAYDFQKCFKQLYGRRIPLLEDSILKAAEIIGLLGQPKLR
jgi:hypothetical protein